MKDKKEHNRELFFREDIPETIMAKLQAAYQASGNILSSGCPDPETVVAYALDDLPPEKKNEVYAHLSECRDCLDLVIELRSAKDQVREEKHEVHERTTFIIRIKQWLAELKNSLIELLSNLAPLPKLVPAAIALVLLVGISIGVYQHLTAPISIQLNLVTSSPDGLLTRGPSEERKINVSKGAILHSGDKFQIVFEPDKDAYVYVFFQDNAGKITKLFSGEAPANKQQTLPGGNDWFKLDENTGQEAVHIMAAKHPVKDLDKVALELTKGGIDSLRKLYPKDYFQSFNFQHE